MHGVARAGGRRGGSRTTPTEADVVGARRCLALTGETLPGFLITRGDGREGEAPPRPYRRNADAPVAAWRSPVLSGAGMNRDGRAAPVGSVLNVCWALVVFA
jgi:hypothetical protein